MKRKALCIVGMMLLAGCGQRGDLYFPEAEREAVITVPAQLPAAPQSTAEDETDETATLPAPTQPGGVGQ
ncbi:MAG: lipoprotein [Pseudomonadota bacterium]|nr:lipoprotein [Pseudomonadota bacterium]